MNLLPCLDLDKDLYLLGGKGDFYKIGWNRRNDEKFLQWGSIKSLTDAAPKLYQ